MSERPDYHFLRTDGRSCFPMDPSNPGSPCRDKTCPDMDTRCPKMGGKRGTYTHTTATTPPIDVSEAYGLSDALNDLNAIAALVTDQPHRYDSSFIDSIHESRFVPLRDYITSQQVALDTVTAERNWLAGELVSAVVQPMTDGEYGDPILEHEWIALANNAALEATKGASHE